MHEIGLMQNVLDRVAGIAKANGAPEVSAIHLRIGVLSGVIAESLEFAFEVLKKGTVAEKARLMVESEPLVCYCKSCRKEFKPDNFSSICPDCRGSDIEVHGGMEMNLISIEVP